MSATDIDWESISWSGWCNKCGIEYDCFASEHIYLCEVCVILFPAESTFGTQLPAPDEPICTKCTRRVSSNDNNNGVQCTRCCNYWARRGTDLFATAGMRPTAKAQRLLEVFEKEQQEMTGKVEAATDVHPPKYDNATPPLSTVPSSETTSRNSMTSSSVAMPRAPPAYIGSTTVHTPAVPSNAPYHAHAPAHSQAATQTVAWNTPPHARLLPRNEAAMQAEDSNDDQVEKALNEALTGFLS